MYFWVSSATGKAQQTSLVGVCAPLLWFPCGLLSRADRKYIDLKGKLCEISHYLQKMCPFALSILFRCLWFVWKLRLLSSTDFMSLCLKILTILWTFPRVVWVLHCCGFHVFVWFPCTFYLTINLYPPPLHSHTHTHTSPQGLHIIGNKVNAIAYLP